VGLEDSNNDERYGAGRLAKSAIVYCLRSVIARSVIYDKVNSSPSYSFKNIFRTIESSIDETEKIENISLKENEVRGTLKFLNSLIRELNLIYVGDQPQKIAEFVSCISVFRDDINAFFKEDDNIEVAGFNEEVGYLKSDIMDLKDRLYQVNDSLKEKIDNDRERDARIDDFLNFLDSAGDTPDSIKSLLQKVSLTFEDIRDRKKKVDSVFDDFLHELSEVQQGLEVDVENSKSSIDKEVEGFHERKRELIEHIESVASSAAEKGVVADHQRTAANEKVVADWLRSIAVVIMLSIVGVAGYSIIYLESFTTEQTILRLIASLLLTMPAAYLARESAKHRQQQHRYHEIALNVAAVNPLISGLEKDQQDRIRAQIASDLLSANTTGASQPISDPMPINTNDLLLKLIDKWPTSSGSQPAQPAQPAQPVQAASAQQPQVPKAESQPTEPAADQPAEHKTTTAAS